MSEFTQEHLDYLSVRISAARVALEQAKEAENGPVGAIQHDIEVWRSLRRAVAEQANETTPPQGEEEPDESQS